MGQPSSPTCPYSANAHSPWTLQFLTEGQSSSGGFVFQNSSLASLLLPKAHSRQQGTQEQEDEEEVKKEGRETHLTLETMQQQQQHDTPLPLSEQWRYTEGLCIRSIAAACLCVSKSALPCVISHHRCTERSSALYRALAAILINPRVADQDSATQPSALLIQSGLSKWLQLNCQYKLDIVCSGSMASLVPWLLDDAHYTDTIVAWQHRLAGDVQLWQEANTGRLGALSKLFVILLILLSIQYSCQYVIDHLLNVEEPF